MEDKQLIPLMGAICGDIIGSTYEGHQTKRFDFKLFTQWSQLTDDTVLTVAVADWILSGRNLVECVQSWGLRYPRAGYGGAFRSWLRADNPQPYNSWGNGSAMRVSPVGWAFDNLDMVLEKARDSAEITHNHPEGVKGAQAVAAAIFMARNGASKDEIRQYASDKFGYFLGRTINEIKPTYQFDVSCQGSVPESIIAFLESSDYETAVRLAVSLGGDADTMAAIAGSIAAAYYKSIPAFLLSTCWNKLTPDIKEIVLHFGEMYNL